MEQKGYQVIEDEERYFVVDEGTLVGEKKVTPNLTGAEVKIIRLNVKDCPLKVNCIELEGNPGEEVSSICKYLGNYRSLKTTVPCHYGGYFERYLFKLTPDPASVKARCARTQFLPGLNPVQKSHAHLVCRT